MLARTCVKYWTEYGRTHYFVANGQRRVKNSDCVYLAASSEYWSVMEYAIGVLHFPYDEKDEKFLGLIIASNRVDLYDRFHIDVSNFAEFLGERGTFEIVDYAIKKKAKIFETIADVALHQRHGLVEKLLRKYISKLTRPDLLSIYTCSLRHNKMLEYIRNPIRGLTNEEIDAIVYGISGIDESSPALFEIMQWFVQNVNIALDMFVDLADHGDEDEGLQLAQQEGNLFNFVDSGDIPLVLLILDALATLNDHLFPLVLAHCVARALNAGNLPMADTIWTRFTKIISRKDVENSLQWDRQRIEIVGAIQFSKIQPRWCVRRKHDSTLCCKVDCSIL